MPIQGYRSDSGSNAPNVRVSIHQPRESNPIPQTRLAKNPFDETGKRGILILGGFFVGLWFLSRVSTDKRIGELNGAGIGDVARFQVDPDNADHVAKVVSTMQEAAVSDPWFREAVPELLRANGVDPEDKMASLTFLHDLIGNQWPVRPDPNGFESITAPQEILDGFIRKGEEGLPSSLDCLTGDTKVVSRDGKGHYERIRMDGMTEGREVLSYNFEEGRYEWRKVTRAWCKGRRDVWEVRLRNGATVTATPDHKMPVLRKRGTHPNFYWQHEVMTLRDFEVLWRSRSKSNKPRLAYSHKIPDPETVYENPDLAWLDGQYISEGYASDPGPRGGISLFISGDKIDQRVGVMERLDNLGVPWSGSRRSRHAYVYVGSGPVRDHFAQFGRSSFDMHIPDNHLSLDIQATKALLDGYRIGDGWTGKRRNRPAIMYSTVSWELSYDLFFLHQRLGVPMNRELQKDHQGVGESPIWRLWIYPEATRGHHNSLEEYPDVAPMPVKSINPLRTQRDVYDITVEGNHNFVLADSGLIVHNCDDRVLMLSSALRVLGIRTKMCLFDTDDDGVLDHLGLFANVDGEVIYAETVVPGTPLGEMPEVQGQSCILA